MSKLKVSLDAMSVKRKMRVAITLISLLPLIVFVYYHFNIYRISKFIFFILAAIVGLGWWVILEMVTSIVNLYTKSQTALQEIVKKADLSSVNVDDEVERLDTIFDMLSSKVRENVEELKSLSHKTEKLNKAFAQKVHVISSLLQANILFSKGPPSEQIFQFLTESLARIVTAKIVITCLKHESSGEYIFFLSGIEENKARALLEKEHNQKIFELKERCVLDQGHKADKFLFIKEVLGIQNFIISPIYLKTEVVGFIIVGNPLDNFTFPADDFESVELFSHNMSIVWEHERLHKKVEALEMIDPLMGIYNERFFFVRLGEEIKRASTYQRPCGVLVMEIKSYSEYRELMSTLEVERILKQLVTICKDNIRPIDILGRIQDNQIGVILIERNKRQSGYVGKKLQEAIESYLREVSSVIPRVSFALAENPVDGVDAAQLFECISIQLREQ